MNGERVADFDEMAAKLAEKKAGDKISLDVRHGSEMRKVQTTLVRRASEMTEAGYRATLENFNPSKCAATAPLAFVRSPKPSGILGAQERSRPPKQGPSVSEIRPTFGTASRISFQERPLLRVRPTIA